MSKIRVYEVKLAATETRWLQCFFSGWKSKILIDSHSVLIVTSFHLQSVLSKGPNARVSEYVYQWAKNCREERYSKTNNKTSKCYFMEPTSGVTTPRRLKSTSDIRIANLHAPLRLNELNYTIRVISIIEVYYLKLILELFRIFFNVQVWYQGQ